MVSEHARATEHARESSARGVRSVVGAVAAIVGRVPVHPLLFAAFAVLFLYAANLHEVLPVDAALPLARNVAGTAIVLAVLSVVFRSVARGAIVATAIVVAYVAFGHVASLATGSVLDDRAQLVAWGLVVVAAVVYAIRARASLPRVTTGLNVVAGLLVISSLVTILPYELGRAGRGSSGLVSEVQAAVSSTGRQRDIYFLIFDRYGSADAIQQRFGITSDLYDWLRGQGFHVPASSHANYRATDFSLAATLNMRFLDDLTRDVGRDTGDRTPARALIQDHEVGRFLQARGYRYYQLGSWFGPTHHVEIADENIALGETSEFESVLNETTIAPAVERVFGGSSGSASAQQQSFRDRVSEGTLLELRQLRRVSTAPGPKFVFAHILLPHDPYVFHADGSIIPEAESRATDEKDALRRPGRVRERADPRDRRLPPVGPRGGPAGRHHRGRRGAAGVPQHRLPVDERRVPPDPPGQSRRDVPARRRRRRPGHVHLGQHVPARVQHVLRGRPAAAAGPQLHLARRQPRLRLPRRHQPDRRAARQGRRPRHTSLRPRDYDRPIVTFDLWTTLIPIAIATTLMPVELTFTLVMLRSPGGRARAGAWIAGKTVVRLVQYALLAGVLVTAVDDGEPGTSPVEGALLLVVAVLLLVAAARKAANQPDEDAPPPRWMTMVGGIQPGRAFLVGAGWVGFSPKLWAFTLAAVGAIADADLGTAEGWLVYVVFVVLASGIHLAALAFAVVAPTRADAVLGRVVDALERNSRPVLIGVSAVFGVWFLIKALRAFGIL